MWEGIDCIAQINHTQAYFCKYKPTKPVWSFQSWILLFYKINPIPPPPPSPQTLPFITFIKSHAIQSILYCTFPLSCLDPFWALHKPASPVHALIILVGLVVWAPINRCGVGVMQYLTREGTEIMHILNIEMAASKTSGLYNIGMQARGLYKKGA